MTRTRKPEIASSIWPSMRPHTVQSIAAELARARRKYPEPVKLSTLQHFHEMTVAALDEHRAGHGTAIAVQTNAITLAAMAIRICEEGAAGYPYLNGTGQRHAPLFTLQPTEEK